MQTAKDIMTTDVITADASMSIRDFARLLYENHISGAPVYDEHHHVIGVATESDLIDRNKKVHIPTVISILDGFVFLESPEKLEKDIKKMAAVTVGVICSRELIAVSPDTPIDEIATLMAEQHVHTLPVMDGDNLVGVIGKTDIIRTMVQDS